MEIKEFLKQQIKLQENSGDATYVPLPRVQCKDGFTISVQVGRGIYSIPAIKSSDIDYTCVELGFPSDIEYDIREYAEARWKLKYTVYPFVPIELVEEVIQKHGGIVN